MKCPLCDKEANFTSVFSEDGEIVYRCHVCQGMCDELELRAANMEPATGVIQ